MGYYSDVGLVLSAKGKDTFQQKLKFASKHAQELFNDCTNSRIDQSSGSVIYAWESIKWYFEACDEIDALIAELDEEEYLFMRLGEELGDVETRGALFDTPFDLRIDSTLAFELPEETAQ